MLEYIVKYIRISIRNNFSSNCRILAYTDYFIDCLRFYDLENEDINKLIHEY